MSSVTARRSVALLVVCALVVLGLALAGGSGAAATGPRARAASVCTVPGAREPIDEFWRPDMSAAARYARSRTGDIAFAVRTAHRFYGYRPDHVEWSASVVKAMLLAAYLDRSSVANRPLNGSDYGLLAPMITHSDNNAASAVDGIVGNGGLSALAGRVRMTHFAPAAPVWGETQITARDQTKYFLHIDQFIAPRHRAYAMHLLASITPSQRWGIGRVAPKGWHLYFKGGWGYGTGLLDHQVVLLTRGCARVSLAVLSMYDGSHPYGKETLRGMFSRLLRGFPTGAPLYPIRLRRRYAATISGAPHSDGLAFTAGPSGTRLHDSVLNLTGDARDRCEAPATTVITTPSTTTTTSTGVSLPVTTTTTTTTTSTRTITVPSDRYVFGDIAVNPHGVFAAAARHGTLRAAIHGRFVSGGRAVGTIVETGHDPASGAACRFSFNFTARAPR